MANERANVEVEKILCPNETMNYMNKLEDFSVCKRIYLPEGSDVVTAKKLRFETHFSPGFPSKDAVLIKYSKYGLTKSRVYVYGLDNPFSWNEISNEKADELLLRSRRI